MDPYDAVLDQLKRAQNRGLEVVTNRMASVMERLDGVIQEAKTSVREAVPKDGDELFPLKEVEKALAELKSQVQATASPAAVPAPTAGITLDLFRRLDEMKSQSELLRELLPVLLEHAGRVVVLVSRGDAISAWSGVGFANAERLRTWTTALGSSKVLDRFNKDGLPVRFTPAEDRVFSGWLEGETTPSEALLVPVCLRGKMMGGFYVDRIPGRPWDPDLAQSLVALVCWMIDTLNHRQSAPTPMIAEAVDLQVAEELALDVEPEPAPTPAPTPEPPPAMAPEPEVDSGYDPSATVRVEMAESLPNQQASFEAVPEPSPAPVPEVVVEPEPEPAPKEEPAPRVEPPPVAPVTPPPPLEKDSSASVSGRSPEDEARHEEAKRFARLLVSEIKLYNENHVVEGRENQDLYLRLKQDIDRSREMYEKRVSATVSKKVDYFHDEIVRILGDNDPSTLGSDYPGPRVES